MATAPSSSNTTTARPALRAKYTSGRCGICRLRIRKGDLIVRGEWRAWVPERYHYEKMRTEGGYHLTLKYAHQTCVLTIGGSDE